MFFFCKTSPPILTSTNLTCHLEPLDKMNVLVRTLDKMNVLVHTLDKMNVLVRTLDKMNVL